MKEEKLIIQKVNLEKNQIHDIRRNIYVDLEKMVCIPIISFFTIFKYPVSIEDSDADMLERILQKYGLTDGFALFLGSLRECVIKNKFKTLKSL